MSFSGSLAAFPEAPEKRKLCALTVSQPNALRTHAMEAHKIKRMKPTTGPVISKGPLMAASAPTTVLGALLSVKNEQAKENTLYQKESSRNAPKGPISAPLWSSEPPHRSEPFSLRPLSLRGGSGALHGHSTNTTSSFEIESQALGSYSPFEESPLPVFQHIGGPHQAPFAVPNSGPSVRQRVISRQELELVLHPSGNRLQSFMEERLVRWTPNDSQNNNEGVLNGNHPYQSNGFGQNAPVESAFRPFSSISSWFGPKTKTVDLEKGPVHKVASLGPVEGSSSDQKTRVPEGHNYASFLAKLKPNSSNSILPEMKHHMPPEEAQRAPTPRAVPFDDLDLHFEKEQGRVPDEAMGSDDDLLSSLGITGGDIISDIDDFIVSCLNGLWTTVDAMWNGCSE